VQLQGQRFRTPKTEQKSEFEREKVCSRAEKES